MRFDRGDATDKALTATAAHDYLRAQIAFQTFADLAGENIAGRQDKRHLLAMYDAYARFLHHLYEFYVACLKLDARDTASISAADRDRRIQTETCKLMGHRAARIRRGDAPRWENRPEYYETPVPADFAERFRDARNFTAHADCRRALPAGGITLADFYQRFHRYALLLFEEPNWLWEIDDAEAFDWGEITAFNLSVRSAPNESRRLGSFGRKLAFRVLALLFRLSENSGRPPRRR